MDRVPAAGSPILIPAVCEASPTTAMSSRSPGGRRRLLARSVVLRSVSDYSRTRPPQFEHVPRELRLTLDLGEPAQFSGQRVAVLGRGQSALEDRRSSMKAAAHVRPHAIGGLEYLAYPEDELLGNSPRDR